MQTEPGSLDRSRIPGSSELKEGACELITYDSNRAAHVEM